MLFTDAVSILSKSSSYAVSTENDLDSYLVSIKEDLYVEMPIEHRFFDVLENLSEHSRKVIFLCGSSGDGKSELLIRAKKRFSESYLKFHLDATHSFAPHHSAVDTLNNLFKEFENSNYSLVIGINIGMLGNYAEEAESQHIKRILKEYLRNGKSLENFEFINFEDYPKFRITREGYEADFVSQLLTKITNPNSYLYKSYILQENSENNSSEQVQKLINYKLLCDKDVQKVIIELLFKIRLFNNQFITARNFLDLIHELICGKGYLFDNLFNQGDNELLEKIKEFDPTLLRTKNIDRFILSFELSTTSEKFKEFKEYLKDFLKIENLNNAMSYIRLFYLLKFSDFGNGYQQDFKEDFIEDLLLNYLEFYRHHQYYDPSISKPILKSFYSRDLVFAIRNYINKKAPYLEEDQYLISEYGHNQIISILKITPNFAAIEKYSSQQPCVKFKTFLKIKDHENISIPVDISLFDLILKLKSGYRPSKNDRSVVVILNKIVNQLLVLANKSNQITVKTSEQFFRLTLEDDEIEVAGIK
ncbi:DNA phosphorothioation-dependent restriction protein DptF [Acinetobacter ursingii]|uniref:DNA phosphorothioation-dependent restriction protein DptF n=2 Tax=Acinetobacter TaxID=469 RepID=UPI00029A87BE|nr:DNA phosphorothioation-dependent restriction protein DptF [Acinetobacter ursingii]ENV75473.1 DNA phosphorothioation-dependent restriction protein DptF [Acinetobacter ursingii DSM 16037 = CIP 107286]QQT66477.1 DNA phosphorothioation-dependent restriction protein DptF [Acinetobacter ursingii]